MKIGLVCPYNLYKGGGVQECVFALQSELTKRGHEVLIITPHSRSFPDVIPSYVRTLGNMTDVKSFHTTAQVSISADAKQIDLLLGTERFDILHFHEPWVPLLSRQLLSRDVAKHVATFHAKLPDTVMSKTIEKVVGPYTKSIIKNIDTMTAVSDAAAEYVRGITDQEIEIIPNGIDIKKYAAIHARSEKNRILFIGRLEKRKGVKYLLDAFKVLSVSVPDAELVIAGDGPDRAKLEEYAEELRLQRVTFTGFVSETKKIELLASARVFCSPAIYGESFGIVLLEAMAAGLPVVAADNPGYRTVMKERGLLSLVDVKNVDDFSRRLELLLLDNTIRLAWQDWAKQYVKQFAYPHIVDMYEALYSRVMAE